MENTSNEEIEVQGDDLQINNQNIELDFAEEEESLPTDEYWNPSPSDHQSSDKFLKNSSKSEYSSSSKVKNPHSFASATDNSEYQKVKIQKADQREMETDEFINDIDEKFKNMKKIEKRDFKNIANINHGKSK